MDFTMQSLDDTLDLVIARAELEGEFCCLKHSKEDPAENHPAVDYLCQGFGNQKEEIVEYIVRIPVCSECVQALYGDEWVLCYCVTCNSSQWIFKRAAKREYEDGVHVIWMDMCPICYKEE